MFINHTSKFKKQFQACTQEIINKDHPIEHVMMERHDIALFQMIPYPTELEEREAITEAFLKAVMKASNELAAYMYDTYVDKLERLLNAIYPEQGDLFQGSLKREHCSIEVQTLILRVAHPVVIATIRWPHIYNVNRIEASKELARVTPTTAFNLCEDSSLDTVTSTYQTCSLGKIIRTALEMYMNKDSPRALALALFRHCSTE